MNLTPLAPHAALAALLSLTAFGCAVGPAVSASMHEAEIVKSATFDHACPVERIHVRASGHGDDEFEVDVCGEQRTYHRVGTMYYDASTRRSARSSGPVALGPSGS
jgi:hypothetical protein